MGSNGRGLLLCSSSRVARPYVKSEKKRNSITAVSKSWAREKKSDTN